MPGFSSFSFIILKLLLIVVNFSIVIPIYNESRSIEKLVHEKIVPNPTICTAEAGSIIFVNTRGLHRGGILLGGSRIALTNYYFNRKLIVK